MDLKLYAVAAGKTRPAAAVDKGSAEQPGKSDDICNAILEDTSSRGRESTSRPPPWTYIARIDEHMKEAVEPEEGRADPQETWIRRRRTSA